MDDIMKKGPPCLATFPCPFRDICKIFQEVLEMENCVEKEAALADIEGLCQSSGRNEASCYIHFMEEATAEKKQPA
jgi:hypothetical protein